MKNVIFSLVLLVLSSCSAYELVGDVNMISTRNVDAGANYELLKTGANDSNSAVRAAKSETLDKAVTSAVLEVPGGEFLKNVKIYTDGKRWAVLGDVWGVADNANVEGFRIGDTVFIRNSLMNTTVSGERYTKAVIAGFKDKTTCLVKLETGEIKEANYSVLSKSGE